MDNLIATFDVSIKFFVHPQVGDILVPEYCEIPETLLFDAVQSNGLEGESVQQCEVITNGAVAVTRNGP